MSGNALSAACPLNSTHTDPRVNRIRDDSFNLTDALDCVIVPSRVRTGIEPHIEDHVVRLNCIFDWSDEIRLSSCYFEYHGSNNAWWLVAQPQQPNDSESTSVQDEPSTRYLVVALDNTIVATLYVPISNTFGSLTLVSWLGSSYLIANAACQPLSGRLTDIFSRRSGLVVCNILFGLGTLLCGVATSKWMLLAGRVVAGMGGEGLNAITAFVASDLVPLRRRGVIQGFVHICYGVGAGLGGLFGGCINDLWG
ncbi:hypothetical protein FNYG_00219 [Fusarium nygamai]|uniref:Major facilitator superfamily (MFS) profile domain-containing protein n=1 Tax=Gibberella nygamai TaxID=42673 RepID=A0A2K0WW63_GIBNY|nr:hypothetical protein FNYG_00219 [Fusarium nygamai]